MKNKFYIFLFILAPLLLSCEAYLDKEQEFSGMDQEGVFSKYLQAEEYLNGAYTDLVTEVSPLAKSADYLPGMTMSGEGQPSRLTNVGAGNFVTVYPTYAAGEYLSLMNTTGSRPNFVARYDKSWEGIRVCCSFLENSDLIADATSEDIDQLKGQAYFLRAFYYHLLTKRHGGLIYLKNTINLNDGFNQVRESYQSNFEDMIEDLDLAISMLPKEWESGKYGRPTKGAAMALKSRITLFAASPLVNESNEASAWTVAAEAAADLINYANENGLYTLADASAAITMDVGHDGADLYVSEHPSLEPYRSIFVGPGVSKEIPEEVIFMEASQSVLPAGDGILGCPNTALTVGFQIMKGNHSPMGIGATANFAKKFETKNGLAIEDDPTYNEQEPFINRDPRFYNNILFDGVPWVATTSGSLNSTGFIDLASINEKGEIGLDKHDFSQTANSYLWKVRNVTGLMIRKWTPNGFYMTSGGNGDLNYHMNQNVFRMAEIYLNYAEAVNEVYGPDGKASNSSLTARQAVNMIRNRVGMPDVNPMYSSKDQFRERIHNERAIELCFEGIRYDDIRRWKVAHTPEYTKVEFLEQHWQGVSDAYPTGYRYTTEAQASLEKTFDEKHYWWPIPTSEIEAVPTFGQTPGW